LSCSVFGFAVSVQSSVKKSYDLVQHGMSHGILSRDELNQFIRSSTLSARLSTSECSYCKWLGRGASGPVTTALIESSGGINKGRSGRSQGTAAAPASRMPTPLRMERSNCR
jgi:hypothetical protein